MGKIILFGILALLIILGIGYSLNIISYIIYSFILIIVVVGIYYAIKQIP
jgi:hypothetical protein